MMLLEAAVIPAERLLFLLIPVALAWSVFRTWRTGVEGRLLQGVLRATVQLSALGFILVPLFGMGESPLVFLVMAGMCCLAALFALGILRRGPGLALWPQAVAAILPVVLGLTAFALGVLIPEKSVLDPRYALSLAGMMAGISMNSTALSGERFLRGLSERRDEVELRLLFGATSREAVRPLLADAVRVAVTPSLNNLMAVGLVSIPGMMSGQVIAGGDPLVAAGYQIMIMVLWVTAAACAPAIFLVLVSRRWLRAGRLPTPGGFSETASFRLADLPELPEPPADTEVHERRPEGGTGPQVFGE